MKKRIAAASLFLSLAASIDTAYALPANEYACKVLTIGDQTGVVMVQADDLAKASETASKRKARRLDGLVEQVKLVVECIPYPGQRFSDTALQAFIDSMPR